MTVYLSPPLGPRSWNSAALALLAAQHANATLPDEYPEHDFAVRHVHFTQDGGRNALEYELLSTASQACFASNKEAGHPSAPLATETIPSVPSTENPRISCSAECVVADILAFNDAIAHGAREFGPYQHRVLNLLTVDRPRQLDILKKEAIDLCRHNASTSPQGLSPYPLQFSNSEQAMPIAGERRTFDRHETVIQEQWLASQGYFLPAHASPLNQSMAGSLLRRIRTTHLSRALKDRMHAEPARNRSAIPPDVKELTAERAMP